MHTDTLTESLRGADLSTDRTEFLQEMKSMPWNEMIPGNRYCAWRMMAIAAALIEDGQTPLVVGTKVAQVHPDFLLPKLDGNFGRLSDYRGKKVLLIHFASW